MVEIQNPAGLTAQYKEMRDRVLGDYGFRVVEQSGNWRPQTQLAVIPTGLFKGLKKFLYEPLGSLEEPYFYQPFESTNLEVRLSAENQKAVTAVKKFADEFEKKFGSASIVLY
jgi:hypothetical protein